MLEAIFEVLIIVGGPLAILMIIKSNEEGGCDGENPMVDKSKPENKFRSSWY